MRQTLHVLGQIKQTQPIIISINKQFYVGNFNELQLNQSVFCKIALRNESFCLNNLQICSF